jgi:uncharacterized alpha-E superfamily protein
VADSIMTYRARYRTAFQLAPVLDLLIVDESNPKSLAFQSASWSAHVEHLPRQERPALCQPEERWPWRCSPPSACWMSRPATATAVKRNRDLAAFLDPWERLKEFAQQISAHYLTRVPATPHFSTLHGRRKP